MEMFNSTFDRKSVAVFPQKLTRLTNLYMAENTLEAVPFIPESVRILHLQVCAYGFII